MTPLCCGATWFLNKLISQLMFIQLMFIHACCKGPSICHFSALKINSEAVCVCVWGGGGGGGGGEHHP